MEQSLCPHPTFRRRATPLKCNTNVQCTSHKMFHNCHPHTLYTCTTSKACLWFYGRFIRPDYPPSELFRYLLRVPEITCNSVVLNVAFTFWVVENTIAVNSFVTFMGHCTIFFLPSVRSKWYRHNKYLLVLLTHIFSSQVHICIYNKRKHFQECNISLYG